MNQAQNIDRIAIPPQGGVAHRSEQLAYIQRVEGSIPSTPTIEPRFTTLGDALFGKAFSSLRSSSSY